MGDHNESINEVLLKAPKNCKITHHEIQKDIVNAVARETSKAIIEDLDNGFFSILVDESRDISVKEQMLLLSIYKIFFLLDCVIYVYWGTPWKNFLESPLTGNILLAAN